MRTDPTDTGGLFATRRPGTRPVQFRTAPQRRGDGRERIDGTIAGALLAVMVLVNLTFWGPLPLACLWLGGHAQYLTDSIGAGLLAAFLTLGTGLWLGLVALKRLDWAWILVRRAAGHDQREGVIGRIFMICCMIGAPAFGVWFIFFSGATLSGFDVQAMLGGG